MQYFKDENNKVFGYTDTQVKRGYGADLTEISSPVKEDGTIYPNHKNIGQLQTKSDGTLYTYYNQDGTPKISEELKKAKTDKVNKIKADCTANNPHTLLVTLANADEKSITFNGGDSSANAIKAGVELVQLNDPKATTIQLWDYYNVLHTVSLGEALNVSKKIGGKYLNDMYKRQQLIMQIKQATTKEEVEAINW